MQKIGNNPEIGAAARGERGKNRRARALTGTAALLLGAGVLTVPAVATTPAATPAAAKSSTIRFHSITKAGTQFRNGGVQVDVDRALNGKVIGYDVLDFAGQNRAWVTVALSGGTLSGVLRLTNNGSATGRLTGGTGRFAGARGTISAPSADPVLVTIRYHR